MSRRIQPEGQAEARDPRPELRHKVQCAFCSLKAPGCNSRRCVNCAIPADGGVARLQLLLPGTAQLRGLATATWITDSILAMSRPSTKGLRQYGLAADLRKQDVSLVFNLQERGEHPYCGEPLLPHTGYTYDPEKDMEGTAVECGGWVDLWVPALDHINRLVCLASAELDAGHKVGRHC